MFDRFSGPVIFAHRGSSARAPENTLAAFNLAAEEGADAVELDAKLTLDGQVVVIHDQTTERTTGIKGTVNRMLLKDLKNLDAGSFFDSRFLGEQIPTLDEVFEAIGKRLLVNVELTNYQSPNDNLIESVAEIVRRHEMQERVLFSSFFASNLRKMAPLLPDTPRALLCSKGILGAMGRSAYGRRVSPAIIHPFYTDVDAGYVNKEHELKRRVHVWTVIHESDMRRLAAAGVDGLIVNDPLKTREVLEEK